MTKRSFEDWTPAQDKLAEQKDYRALKTGPKGYKERNKRKHEEAQEVHAEEVEEMALDAAEEQDQDLQQSSKRRKAEGKQYIPVYEREIKAPKERASKVMKPSIKTTWEKKMQDKATRQMFLEQKKAAVTAIKDKKKEIGLQRKASRERKEANKAKSVVVQKITNNATLKKMMKNKKQKKMLKKADTN